MVKGKLIHILNFGNLYKKIMKQMTYQIEIFINISYINKILYIKFYI